MDLNGDYQTPAFDANLFNNGILSSHTRIS